MGIPSNESSSLEHKLFYINSECIRLGLRSTIEACAYESSSEGHLSGLRVVNCMQGGQILYKCWLSSADDGAFWRGIDFLIDVRSKLIQACKPNLCKDMYDWQASISSAVYLGYSW